MQIFAEAGSYRPPSGDEPNDWIVHLTTSDLSLGTYSIPAGGVDDQQPHTEDEIYVVTTGRATMVTASGTGAGQRDLCPGRGGAPVHRRDRGPGPDRGLRPAVRLPVLTGTGPRSPLPRCRAAPA